MVLLIAGCKKSGGKNAPPEPPAKPPAKLTVITGPGDAIQPGDVPGRSRLWHVYWQSADISAVGEKPQVGTMRTVHGEIDSGKDSKDFKADQAVAVDSSHVLTLTGHVSVTFPSKGAQLNCDKLVYFASRKLFDASGGVSLVSKNTEIGGVPEALADSDFNQVASPDQFQEKK